MSTKPLPFNTGKVLIGSRYEPPRRYEMSRDMETLQRKLLEERLGRRATAASAIVLYITALFCLALWWVMK